jgi:hypothetical protein
MFDPPRGVLREIRRRCDTRCNTTFSVPYHNQNAVLDLHAARTGLKGESIRVQRALRRELKIIGLVGAGLKPAHLPHAHPRIAGLTATAVAY